MKKSEFKSFIKENIIDILNEATEKRWYRMLRN